MMNDGVAIIVTANRVRVFYLKEGSISRRVVELHPFEEAEDDYVFASQ
jgi:hypothetical protein